MKYLIKQNAACAGEEDDGICMFCSIGDELVDDEQCKFDSQKINNDCPGFECSEQCRECPGDCEFLG